MTQDFLCASNICLNCFLTVYSPLCPELIWSDLSGPAATATGLIPTGPSAKTFVNSRLFQFALLLISTTPCYVHTIVSEYFDYSGAWLASWLPVCGGDQFGGGGTFASTSPALMPQHWLCHRGSRLTFFFSSSPYFSTQFLYNLIKNVFKHFCCSGCSVALATKFTHYYEVPEAWSWAGTLLLSFFFPLLSFHLAILFAVPIQQTTQRRLYFINKSYRVFFPSQSLLEW